MSRVLVDTNVLVRLFDPASHAHAECAALLQPATAAPLGLVLCAQVLIEFWVVATRPLANNGLALQPAEADAKLDQLLYYLPCVEEPPDVAARWRRLVRRFDVKGVPAHDARLVAVMEAHGIARFCTLNPAHFQRYGHIRCVSPAALLTP